jgi:hypothetical protein
MSNETETKEAKIETVPGGIKCGNRVRIKSGEINGVDLSGFEGHVIRDEQYRGNGASGKTEEMVMVQVDTGGGKMSLPIDLPRRRVKGPKDGGLGGAMRAVGKLFGIIRNGKYVRVAQ